jgi:hypothetical protein
LVEEEKKVVEVPKDDERTYKKRAFGLDLGIGQINDDGTSETAFDLGVRYMRYFTPYIGADFFKFKMNLGFGEDYGVDHFTFNPQLMTGVRGSSPRFVNDRMHVYAAFKFGIGATLWGLETSQTSESYAGGGFCYEFEIGIHLTRTLFLAYAYNHQGGTLSGDGSDVALDHGYSALRLGFNFGGNTPYNK